MERKIDTPKYIHLLPCTNIISSKTWILSFGEASQNEIHSRVKIFSTETRKCEGIDARVGQAPGAICHLHSTNARRHSFPLQILARAMFSVESTQFSVTNCDMTQISRSLQSEIQISKKISGHKNLLNKYILKKNSHKCVIYVFVSKLLFA